MSISRNACIVEPLPHNTLVKLGLRIAGLAVICFSKLHFRE